MEIKARLKKPYTDEARIEFIVENNHNNGWEIKETDTELQALGYSDLEINRALKLNELKSIKDSKLSEFSYKDKIYQIDDNSKVNINGKISAILLSQNTEKPIESVNWIAKDNTITQFSTVEFLAFSQAVANHIETILFKNDELRTAINKAKSLEALNKINLNFGG